MCGHSSRRRVAADAHQRPTRRFRHLLEPPVAYRADTPRCLVLAACASLPIWSCSVWGLPCLTPYSGSGALLPHLFTLTPARKEQALCGMLNFLAKAQVAEAVSFLWHWPSLSLKAQIPDVIRHTALRSSDFPPPVYSLRRNRQRPPSSLATLIPTASSVFHICLFCLNPNPDLDAAHKHCFANRPELVRSETCGCFYCFAIFSPAEIHEWIDDDQTAIYPKCPVDAVIRSASGYPIEKSFRKLMHDYWFSTKRS